jgi:hypothetical protein
LQILTDYLIQFKSDLYCSNICLDILEIISKGIMDYTVLNRLGIKPL